MSCAGVAATGDYSPNLVKLLGGMSAAPHIQIFQGGGQAEQKSQLLHTQIGAGEVGAAVSGIGGLDEGFEDVERGRLDAVAEEKLLAAWEFLDCRDKPEQKLEVRFEGWAVAARGLITGCVQNRFRSDQGLRPWTP